MSNTTLTREQRAAIADRRRRAKEAYLSRTETARHNHWSGWWGLHKNLVLTLTAIFLGVPSLAIAADGVAHLGRIHTGVIVGGYQVGGMKPTEARSHLMKAATTASKTKLMVTYRSKKWEVDKKALSGRPQVDTAIKQAMRVGRDGSAPTMLGDRLAAFFSPQEIAFGVSLDENALDDFVDELGDSVDVEPTNAGVKMEGDQLEILPSAPGLAITRTRFKASVRKGIYGAGITSIKLPVVVVPAPVTVTEAKAAAGQASVALKAPVTLNLSEDTWVLSVKEIEKMLVFVPRKTGISTTLGVGLDPKAFRKKMIEATKKHTIEAEPAKFRIREGKVGIIPHVPGVEVDTDKARESAERRLLRPAPRVVSMTTHTYLPKRTTEKAESMGIVETIETFTTNYPPGNRPRVSNIQTLSRALDGTLVPPGATFSFNGTVGQRTAAKGYKEAPVIADGVLKPDIGGGVCQVSTTVFNAALMAGLPVPSRRNHSLYISKYPDGRDASVSFPAPDLRFTNDTEGWILMTAFAGSSSVTVGLYGTDPKREVELKSSGFYGSKDPPTKKVDDPKLEIGKEVIEENGSKGRSIWVKRWVRKNGRILQENQFYSTYRPEPKIIRVGTKKVEATPDASSSSTKPKPKPKPTPTTTPSSGTPDAG